MKSCFATIAAALLLVCASQVSAIQFQAVQDRNLCFGDDGGTVVLASCSGVRELEFSGYGEVKLDGRCLSSVARDRPLIWAGCNNTPSQRWARSSFRFNNEAGYCADVKGARYAVRQEIIAYSCDNRPNQQWITRNAPAQPITRPPQPPSNVVITPRPGDFQKITLEQAVNLVAQGGGNFRYQDATRLVAQGGGNFSLGQLFSLVAQGGGNLVAQGGGNSPKFTPKIDFAVLQQLVAQGGGNMQSLLRLVAQGGGNLVAQGGGNLQQYAVADANALTLRRLDTNQTFLINNVNQIVSTGGGNLVIDLRTVKYNPIDATTVDVYSADGKWLFGRISNGNFLVAQGGGNIVSTGGGNIVSTGGGNIILPDGQQVSLVSQGGGNLVSQGGGNFAAGTSLQSIITSAVIKDPPVAPLTGRSLASVTTFNSLKMRTLASVATTNPGQTPGVVAPPSPSPRPPQTVTLPTGGLVNQDASASRCMTVPGGSARNDLQLVVDTCRADNPGQKFDYQPLPNDRTRGYLRIVGTDKCVAAYDGGGMAARVGVWDCVNHVSQLWTISGGTLRLGPGGRCIGVRDGSQAAGASLILWDCVPAAANQQWRMS